MKLIQLAQRGKLSALRLRLFRNDPLTGMVEYLSKPINGKELFALIETLTGVTGRTPEPELVSRPAA